MDEVGTPEESGDQENSPGSSLPLIQFLLPANGSGVRSEQEVPVSDGKAELLDVKKEVEYTSEYETTAEANYDKTVILEDYIGSDYEAEGEICWLSCSLCEYKTNDEKELQNHNKNVHKLKNWKTFQPVFMCYDCGYRSKSAARMDIHKIAHLENQGFNCEECEFFTDTEDTFREHSEIHFQNSGLVKTCPVCKQVFHKSIDFRRHKDEAHIIFQPTEVKEFKCPHCMYAHTNKLTTWRHVIDHFRPMKKCDYCDYTTKKPGHMTRHTLSRHLEKKVKRKPKKKAMSPSRTDEVSPSYFALQSEVSSSQPSEDPQVESCTESNELEQVKYFENEFSSEDLDENLMSGKSTTHSAAGTDSEQPTVRRSVRRAKKLKKDTPIDIEKNCQEMVFDEDSNEPFLGFLPSDIVEHKLIPKECEVLQCRKCKFTSKSKMSMKTHSKTHSIKKERKLYFKTGNAFTYRCSSEKVVKCDRCDYGTKNPLNMQVHESIHDEPQVVYKCPNCHFSAKDDAELRRHFTTHLGNSDFIAVLCCFCDQTFRSNQELGKHKSEKHLVVLPLETKKFKCPECDKQFCQKAKVWEHLRVHFGKRFKKDCAEPGCSYASVKLHDLRRHYIVNHSREKLNVFITALKQTFSTSLIVQRDPTFNKKRRKKGKTIFTCSFCPYQTDRECHFDLHRDVHSDQTYPCSQCTFTTRSRVSLRIHERNHDVVKRFRCQDCDYQSNQKPAYRNHRMKHDGIKLYQCDHCLYKTNYKLCITRHQVVHKIKEETLSCDLCDYKTRWKNDLEFHMLDHRT